MAFVKKMWKDRLSEFAGRRRLTDVSTGTSTVVDVTRDEGEVSQQGDAFSAANMNDLENRIGDEFNQLNDNIRKVNVYVGDDGKLHFVDSMGADSELPFNGSRDLNILNVQYLHGTSGSITISAESTIYVLMWHDRKPNVMYNGNPIDLLTTPANDRTYMYIADAQAGDVISWSGGGQTYRSCWVTEFEK